MYSALKPFPKRPDRVRLSPQEFNRWYWWRRRLAYMVRPNPSARWYQSRVESLRRAVVVDDIDRQMIDAIGAIRDTTGLQPRDNQILAALGLLDGLSVEMSTGEGKTLATGLAALTAAQYGMAVHIATPNAYLSARDAAWLSDSAAVLGLTVGQVDVRAPTTQGYNFDIVYADNKTLVFDCLRELQGGAHQLGLGFCIIDELDAVAIDDASTPVILSQERPRDDLDARLFEYLVCWAKSAKVSEDYVDAVYPRTLPRGVQTLAVELSRFNHPAIADSDLTVLADTALLAVNRLHLGEHYLVDGAHVQMIDETTGRLSKDRKWQYGLQQMIEAKEGVAQSGETVTLEGLTQQRFFSQYRSLAGLSGTIQETRTELYVWYGLRTLKVPDHRPSNLVAQRFVCFRRDDSWRAAIVSEIQDCISTGRPVLVGCHTVSVAQFLFEIIVDKFGHCVQIIDANSEADEAERVRRAGEPGMVTVATNVAGRGTDIGLAPECVATGGLHVMVVQAMPSMRHFRQLIGRSARQGQPGSYSQLIRWSDDVIQTLGAWPKYLDLFPFVWLSLCQKALQWRLVRDRQRQVYRETSMNQEFEI